MADSQTMASTATSTDGASPARRVHRLRGLPGGRAVVGALLVTAAAVGVLAAYLDAVAEPDTRYLVARADIEPGTRLASTEVVAELFDLQPLALDGPVADRAYSGEQLEGLLGRRIVVPLVPGDLLLRSGVVEDGGIADAHSLSFAVNPSAAVAGRLRAGELIDVLATYGSGESAWTGYVVRAVPLIAVDRGEGAALAGSGPFVLTVAVASPEEVQALTHALHAADIVVTRATGGEPGPTPPPFRPARDGPGAEDG